jgi:hypothetical protein
VSTRVLVLSLVVTIVPLAGPTAAAEVSTVRRGACTGPSHWRLAVVPDGDVLRVRLSARGGRAGQQWSIYMDRNGTGFFAGYRISGEFGSWVVRRIIRNLPGVDTIKFGALNRRTGETCRGRASV